MSLFVFYRSFCVMASHISICRNLEGCAGFPSGYGVHPWARLQTYGPIPQPGLQRPLQCFDSVDGSCSAHSDRSRWYVHRPQFLCILGRGPIASKSSCHLIVWLFCLVFQVLGQALISTILCVMPFLEQDLIDNLPSLVASSIVHMPSSLHGYIVQVLCCFLLPLTMGWFWLLFSFGSIIDLVSATNQPDCIFFKTGNPPTDGVFNVIEPSVPGIIMAVLQYTTNSGSPIYCRNKIVVVFWLDF